MPEVSICCCLEAIFPNQQEQLTHQLFRVTFKHGGLTEVKNLNIVFFISFADGLFVYAEELTLRIAELLLINSVRRRRSQTTTFLVDSSFPFSGAFFQKTSF